MSAGETPTKAASFHAAPIDRDVRTRSGEFGPTPPREGRRSRDSLRGVDSDNRSERETDRNENDRRRWPARCPFGDGYHPFLNPRSPFMGVCAKSLWEDPRAKFDGGSCFYCNRATEAECRRSWLFGDRLNMRECTKDTAIFLQNRYTKTVEGVFIAVDGPRMNIEPDAFSGTFSEQVRVHPHPVHCYPPVPVTDLPSYRSEITYHWDGNAPVLPRRLSVEITCKLIEALREAAKTNEVAPPRLTNDGKFLRNDSVPRSSS